MKRLGWLGMHFSRGMDILSLRVVNYTFYSGQMQETRESRVGR